MDRDRSVAGTRLPSTGMPPISSYLARFITEISHVPSRRPSRGMHPPSSAFFQVLLLLICVRGPAELCAQSSVDHQNVLAAVHSRRVHAFFYLWYGNPEVDGKWQHWDHEVLPHWDASLRDRYINPNRRGLMIMTWF